MKNNPGTFFGTFFASSFDLFTVTFGVAAVGTSSLDLGVFAIGDFYGDPLNVGVQNSSLTATTVPEPGILALFGIGLAGLGLTRRHAKSDPFQQFAKTRPGGGFFVFGEWLPSVKAYVRVQPIE